MDKGKSARRVLVTGAGSGLGRAIAERLAGSGDEVTGTVRSPERAAALTDQARLAGLPLRFLPLELSATEQIHATARTLEAEGGIDVLVHNAGFGIFGAIEQTDGEATSRQFAVNLFGPLELTRLLLPGLRTRGGGGGW
ncbi:MAG: SDR family NAD(P)-dependent oxidoreductase, partial [Myxococcales bacterium]